LFHSLKVTYVGDVENPSSWGKWLSLCFRTRTRVVAAMMGAAAIRGENLEHLRIPYF